LEKIISELHFKAIYIIGFVLGIPILVFVISIVGGLLHSLIWINTLFGGILVFGLIAIGADGVWYYEFRRSEQKIQQALDNPPIHLCPACGNEMVAREIEKKGSLGIPHSDLSIECPSCHTQFDSYFPFQSWLVVEANAEKNKDFAWLYGGENLSRDEVVLIANGKYTMNAIQKLRARALPIISDGDFEQLSSWDPQLLIKDQNVQIYLNPPNNSWGLSLKDAEHIWFVSNQVTFAEQRTREKVPYLLKLDNGIFFITNLKYGFIGRIKNLDKKLTEITSIQEERLRLDVFRKNRISAEYFLGLDAELASSILEGLTKLL